LSVIELGFGRSPEGDWRSLAQRRVNRVTEIQWTLYPYVAELEHAKAWLGIQKKLLRAPKTIDAYARGLNDFLSICRRFAIRV